MSRGSDAERWDRRHRERGGAAEPSPFVTSLPLFSSGPPGMRILDVAGGSGRHAVWLAERGFSVTLVDVSEVAVALAAQKAESRGVRIETCIQNLNAARLPVGPWDVILCFHYLERRLFAQFHDALVPGGVLVFVQPTTTNLERHSRPSERFLLEDGELSQWVKGYEPLHFEEGWNDEGRHEVRFVGRRSA